MIAEKILDRLESVRETGPGRWIARCPAHDDRSPSLSIREIDDLLLLHCFSGCDVSEVVSAAGLELSDLFPDRPRSHKPISKPIPTADVLRCLSSEITVLMLCASDLAKCEKLDNDTKERLMKSAQRFSSALSAGGLT